MPKYMILYHSEAAKTGPGITEFFQNTPPEEMQKGMEMWGKWYETHGQSIKDFGAPLDHGMSVTGSGSQAEKSSITGYTVVEAENGEEAAKIVSGHPHLHMPGSKIELLEFVPMDGM